MNWFAQAESLHLDAEVRERLGGHYLHLSDGVTYYIDEGPVDGFPVVMLHGATLPSWCFDGVAERLVAEGARVIRFDGYGRGRSDRVDRVHDIELFVRQLAEVLDTLEIERCDIVGFSLGAAVASTFCGRQPDRVRRLVILAPLVRYARDPRLIRLACRPRVGHVISATIGVHRVVQRAESLFGTLGRAPQNRSALIEQISLRGFQRSMRSIMAHCVLADHEPAYRSLGQTKIPTLVLWGDQDLETRRSHMELVLSHHRHARLRVFRGLGHGLAMQGVRRCSAAINDFLQPITAVGATATPVALELELELEREEDVLVGARSVPG